MGNEHLPTPQDYAEFVDKNSRYYVLKFKKFTHSISSFHASWNWPAFFASWWWFLYRKMYFWAVLCLVSMSIPHITLFAWVTWPILANHLYYKHSHKKISEIKSSQGSRYAQYLATIGGVHGWVPPVAIAVALVPILLALFFFSLSAS